MADVTVQGEMAELVGGPADGAQIWLLTGEWTWVAVTRYGNLQRPTIFQPFPGWSADHVYWRTDRRTAEGLLVYEVVRQS